MKKKMDDFSTKKQSQIDELEDILDSLDSKWQRKLTKVQNKNIQSKIETEKRINQEQLNREKTRNDDKFNEKVSELTQQ